MNERPFPLKPMTVGNILDYSFRIYRNNFKNILIFSALIGALFNLILLILTKLAAPPGTLTDPWPYIIDGIKSGNWDSVFNNILTQQVFSEQFGPNFFIRSVIMMIIAYGGMFVVYVFINPFVHGGIVNITSGYFHGTPFDASTTYKETWKRYGKLILTALSLVVCYIVCYILMIVLVIMLALLFIGLSAVDSKGFAVFIGMLVFLIVLAGVYAVFFTSISFVYPIAISEGVYHFKAIGRSFKLAFKKFWRVLGVILLVYLLVNILNTAVGGILILIAVLSPIQIFFQETITLFTSAIAAPILYITITMLYFDMRIRTEGYDLELLSDEMKGNEEWENTSY